MVAVSLEWPTQGTCAPTATMTLLILKNVQTKLKHWSWTLLCTLMLKLNAWRIGARAAIRKWGWQGLSVDVGTCFVECIDTQENMHVLWISRQLEGLFWPRKIQFARMTSYSPGLRSWLRVFPVFDRWVKSNFTVFFAGSSCFHSF